MYVCVPTVMVRLGRLFHEISRSHSFPPTSGSPSIRALNVNASTQLQILVGSGNAYEETGFGEMYPRRMFNGRVIYEKMPQGGNLIVKEDSSVGTLQPQVSGVMASTRAYLETLWNGGIKNSGSK